MKLRLQILTFLILFLLVGYATGLYSASLKFEGKIQQSTNALSSCITSKEDLSKRLESLCGPAVLKFVPCENGLEVCVCGDPSKYLEKTE